MHFAIICIDKPDHEALRQENRAAHLDYLAGFKDQVFAAGPLQSDDGAQMKGSVLILDLPDRAAADAFAAGDPYAKAGLFESVITRRWKKVLPPDPAR